MDIHISSAAVSYTSPIAWLSSVRYTGTHGASPPSSLLTSLNSLFVFCLDESVPPLRALLPSQSFQLVLGFVCFLFVSSLSFILSCPFSFSENISCPTSCQVTESRHKNERICLTCTIFEKGNA